MSSFRESRQKTNNDGPFLHRFVLFRKNRLFCPCCHVWSLLSKKTTPTLPLLHRQAKKRADSCSGYRPEIPDERAAAGGEGRQRRRVAARPWGEEALSPRGRASHSVDGGIDSVRDDVILAHSTAVTLVGTCGGLHKSMPSFGRDVLRSCVGACAPITTTAFLSKLQQAPSRRHGAAAIFSPRPAFDFRPW